MATAIRDALEVVLQAGIKAWGLNISDRELRDGIRCFTDDREVLATAAALKIPEKLLLDLPELVRLHPDIFKLPQISQNWQEIYPGWAQEMLREVLAAFKILEPVLRQEIDPEYFGGALMNLICLAFIKYCPEVREQVEMNTVYSGTSLTQYAEAVVKEGWSEIKRMQARLLRTELGQQVEAVVSRQARQAFTLLVIGDHAALTRILSQMLEEVNHADHRTNHGGHEDHPEEAR